MRVHDHSSSSIADLWEIPEMSEQQIACANNYIYKSLALQMQIQMDPQIQAPTKLRLCCVTLSAINWMSSGGGGGGDKETKDRLRRATNIKPQCVN